MKSSIQISRGIESLFGTRDENIRLLESGLGLRTRLTDDAALEIEGEERFEGLQKFFAAVHSLTSERRLSRIAYLVEKPAA